MADLKGRRPPADDPASPFHIASSDARAAGTLLIDRQPIHAVPAQNAMHRGTGNRQPVKPFR
jgi:hypothetical protein